MKKYHIYNNITKKPLCNILTKSEGRMRIARYIGQYVFKNGFVYDSKIYSIKELKKSLVIKNDYHPQLLLTSWD